MKKIFLFLFSLFILSAIYYPPNANLYAQDDTVTLLTYYPAPYGTYQTIQIGQPGHFLQIDYDSDNQRHRIFSSNTSDNIVLSNNGTDNNLVIATTGRIGIGTDTPEYPFHATNMGDSCGYFFAQAVSGPSNTAALRGEATGDAKNTGTHIGIAGIARGQNPSVGTNYGLLSTAIGSRVNAGLFTNLNNSNVASNTGILANITGNNNTSGNNGILTMVTGQNTINSGAFCTAGGGTTNYGVRTLTTSIPTGTACGINSDVRGNGTNYGIYSVVSGTGTNWAGHFGGNVNITGSLSHNGTAHSGWDIAEWIKNSYSGPIQPGNIVVIDDKNKGVKLSEKENDTGIAGIVSKNPGDCGGYLRRNNIFYSDKKMHAKGYIKLALAGQVVCKADAYYGEIKRGDLLATSPTPGHAMKAKPIGELNGHPVYPQGCIVGKALEPLKEGKGKILVLVCLM